MSDEKPKENDAGQSPQKVREFAEKVAALMREYGLAISDGEDGHGGLTIRPRTEFFDEFALIAAAAEYERLHVKAQAEKTLELNEKPKPRRLGPKGYKP